MARWLVVASLLWPALAAATVWQRIADPHAGWTAAVYVAASRICHQRPERSFHTAGVQWPVCGRCSGLYLGAAIGGFLLAAGRRRDIVPRGALVRLIVASVPTVLIVAFEWAGAPVGNLARALTAVPLGLTIAVLVIGAAAPRREKAIR